MSNLMALTEIGFPSLPLGSGVQAMWFIDKRSRRSGGDGKPTAGATSGSPDGVRPRLRCPSIATQVFPSRTTGGDVSVSAIRLDML